LRLNISGGEKFSDTETFHSHYSCLKRVQVISRKAGLLKKIWYGEVYEAEWLRRLLLGGAEATSGYGATSSSLRRPRGGVGEISSYLNDDLFIATGRKAKFL
jgi:hypothetical protein